MSEKIVVTGGAGFIGSHLVDSLVEQGLDVHIVDNLSSGNKKNINKQAMFHELDVRDFDGISSVLRDSDCVFHLAAIMSVPYSIEHPIETDEINFGGTKNVLMGCTKNKVRRFILASSAAIYGDTKALPTSEKQGANPQCPYAVQKYVSELYAKMWKELYGLETVSLRFFNVYGPRQNSEGAYAGVISKFAEWNKDREILKITGSGNQTRDSVFVMDVVSSLLSAMNSEKVGNGEVINIGSGVETSINDLASAFGGEKEYVKVRVEIKNSLSDISLVKKLLDWSPKVSLEKGISELVKSLK